MVANGKTMTRARADRSARRNRRYSIRVTIAWLGVGVVVVFWFSNTLGHTRSIDRVFETNALRWSSGFTCLHEPKSRLRGAVQCCSFCSNRTYCSHLAACTTILSSALNVTFLLPFPNHPVFTDVVLVDARTCCPHGWQSSTQPSYRSLSFEDKAPQCQYSLK